MLSVSNALIDEDVLESAPAANMLRKASEDSSLSGASVLSIDDFPGGRYQASGLESYTKTQRLEVSRPCTCMLYPTRKE